MTGIHISSYGVDLEQKDSLLTLLQAIHEVDGIERIRLGSLEPRIITEEFACTISKMPKICPHFHLSLQSGCDATLKRMNRHYTTEEYYTGCCYLRKYYEHPAITTDIITGFPGETEEEFAQTVEFVRKVNFYETHIFKYSRRQGTRADKMDNQVPEEVKAKRSNVLLALNKENSCAFRKYYIGRQEEILMEESAIIDGQRYETGYNREYVKMAVRTETDMTNAFVQGQITDFLKEDVLGMEQVIK